MASVNVSGRTRGPMTIPIPATSFAISGTVTIGGTDYTNRMISCTIEGKSIKEGCHTCQFTFDNSGGFFINRVTGFPILTGGEAVKINFDYGSGTTRLFTGKAEYPQFSFNNNGYIMTLNATSLPEAKDRRVRIKFDGVTHYNAVKQLIDTYLSSVATYSNFTTNLQSETGTVTASYNDYLHRIMADIFDRAGWDGYWDFDSTDTGKHDLQGFARGGVINDNVTCTVGQNIISVTGWGKDFTNEYNTVKVIGKNVGGGSSLKTVANTTLRDQFWRRDKEVSDSRLTSSAELTDKATYELNETTARYHGSVTITGHKDILPARSVRCYAVHAGINGAYPVLRYTHNIGTQWLTTIDLNDHVSRYADGILDRVKVEEGLKDFDNPNDMDNSLNYDFDGETDAANGIASRGSNVRYTNSVISLTSGTQGSVTSITTNLSSDVTQTDMLLKNPVQFGLSTVEVSNDGGINYVTLSSVNVPVLFPNAGSKIKIRVTLKADSGFHAGPTLDGITVRVK